MSYKVLESHGKHTAKGHGKSWKTTSDVIYEPWHDMYCSTSVSLLVMIADEYAWHVLQHQHLTGGDSWWICMTCVAAPVFHCGDDSWWICMTCVAALAFHCGDDSWWICMTCVAAPAFDCGDDSWWICMMCVAAPAFHCGDDSWWICMMCVAALAFHCRLVLINAVALHWAQLVLGWVTAFWQVNCLST